MSKMLKVVGASWLRTKVSSYILGLLGVLAILALFLGHFERSQEDGNYAATIFYSNKTGYRIEYWGQSNELANIPRGVARAYIRKDIDITGWSLLEVETDGSYPDEIQAYAAGVVEGALTWFLIHTHLDNTIRWKCSNQTFEKRCDKLRDALDKSVNIWKTYAAERANTEPFWHHVSLHYTQINGIFTGWKYGVERSMNEYETDISDLYWLNAVAEATEIEHKLNISLEDPIHDTLPGLSSAFLRILNVTSEDGTNIRKLFIAQNAVGGYSTMTRILKRYRLNYHTTSNSSIPAPGVSVDFSGYPGSITSQDEFYVVKGPNHTLGITGTSLKNYNDKLWKNVNITEQVPLGPRITAANHIASNVSTWGHILASNNSGTGSKQWLVIDFTKLNQNISQSNATSRLDKSDRITEVTIKNSIKHTIYHHTHTKYNGLLWLVEQVPGYTHSADLSDAFLEQGYWATYGLPFFKNTSNITNVTGMELLYGEIFSKTNSPRSVVFQNGFKNATSVSTIIDLMRKNNMKIGNNETNNHSCVEDIVLCDKEYWSVPGIRGDIVSDVAHKKAYGVIDTKVVYSTSEPTTNINFIAISSPPYVEIPKKVSEEVPINKATVASIYTDKFDDKPNINGIEIRDLVKQQQEEAEQELLENLNKNTIQPFQWSESDFENDVHGGLPDKWNFHPFKPNWAW